MSTKKNKRIESTNRELYPVHLYVVETLKHHACVHRNHVDWIITTVYMVMLKFTMH